MSTKFMVRVRHAKGTTRFDLANKSSTNIKQLKQLIHDKLSDKPPISSQQLTPNGKSTDTPFTNDSILSSLDIKHGDMFYLKIISSAIICHSDNRNSHTRTNRKRKLPQTQTNTNSNPSQPPKKRTRLNSNNHNRSNTNTRKPRKKPIKKKQGFEFVIKSEGDSIAEIVNNYFSVSSQSQISLQLLPINIQKLYTKQARVEAILDEKVEITEFLERSRFSSKAKSRGKRHLIVNYSFQRKKRKEIVCFYSDEQMQEIISNVLWESVEEKEREQIFVKNAINHQNILELCRRNMLTVNEIASRSPPLLWSLVHSFPNQQIENVLEKFIKVALKELRAKQQNNES